MRSAWAREAQARTSRIPTRHARTSDHSKFCLVGLSSRVHPCVTVFTSLQSGFFESAGSGSTLRHPPPLSCSRSPRVMRCAACGAHTALGSPTRAEALQASWRPSGMLRPARLKGRQDTPHPHSMLIECAPLSMMSSLRVGWRKRANSTRSPLHHRCWIRQPVLANPVISLLCAGSPLRPRRRQPSTANTGT